MSDNYILVKQLIGALLFIDLLAYTPNFFTYFGPAFDLTKWWNTKLALAVTYICWAVASVMMVFDAGGIVPVVFLFIIFRHYFIKGWWRSLLRGAGAVGFMPHYAILFLLLFEISFIVDPTLALADYVQMVLRVDFAFIMICAGLYKVCVGYCHRNGMEYAAVNPLWSYQYRWMRNITPSHPFWHLQNLAGAGGELAIGVLLLVPSLQTYGGVLSIFSFAYLLPIMRLGRLAVLMMVISLLFVPDLGVFTPAANIPLEPRNTTAVVPEIFLSALMAVAYLYCFLLPLVKLMQYMHLFGQRRFPPSIQRGLEWVAGLVPIIIWRVFTADIVNFFVRVSLVSKVTKEERLLVHEDDTYHYGNWGNILLKHRFLQVAESIAIAVIFNSLKYFASQRELFEDKLFRYAATIPRIQGEFVRFTFISIQKEAASFEYLPTAQFDVDIEREAIIETSLSDRGLPGEIAERSPIREW